MIALCFLLYPTTREQLVNVRLVLPWRRQTARAKKGKGDFTSSPSFVLKRLMTSSEHGERKKGAWARNGMPKCTFQAGFQQGMLHSSLFQYNANTS